MVYYTDDVLKVLCDFINDPVYQFDLVTGKSLDRESEEAVEIENSCSLGILNTVENDKAQKTEDNSNDEEIDIQKQFKIPSIFDF